MNMDRLKYRYWEHEVWNDPTSPLVAKYTDIVAGRDPTVAVFDFEFSTGLKDKNGNLIYEGDIIRFCVKRRGYILTYERIVVWDKDKCSFVVRNAEDQAAPLAKWRMPHPDTHIIEVVGNIHKQADQKEQQ